jgi:hypothetical protein
MTLRVNCGFCLQKTEEKRGGKRQKIKKMGVFEGFSGKCGGWR